MSYIADNVDEFYKPGKVERKKNGEPRYTHDAQPILKQIHDRIKNRILKQAVYPYYMLGGISDPEFHADVPLLAAVVSSGDHDLANGQHAGKLHLQPFLQIKQG